jgi:flavin reductase (DIM6/NTAB) family NADH-FMN oxidoreductase RutF
MFHYGLFVATCRAADGPRGATVSWATQVSFEPKQIAIALRKGAAICDAVQVERRFGLHIVGEQQPELARAFFRVTQMGPEEIAGYRYSLSPNGVPVLHGAIAWLECEVMEQCGQTGDHTLFIGAVINGDIQTPGIHSLALRDTVWHYGG